MDNKNSGFSIGKWLVRCFILGIVLIFVPIILGVLGFIGSIFLPLICVAVPIMVLAFIWCLIS